MAKLRTRNAATTMTELKHQFSVDTVSWCGDHLLRGVCIFHLQSILFGAKSERSYVHFIFNINEICKILLLVFFLSRCNIIYLGFWIIYLCGACWKWSIFIEFQYNLWSTFSDCKLIGKFSWMYIVRSIYMHLIHGHISLQVRVLLLFGIGFILIGSILWQSNNKHTINKRWYSIKWCIDYESRIKYFTRTFSSLLFFAEGLWIYYIGSVDIHLQI